MLTRAEAWCWVAHLYSKESDALLYKWPRTNADEVEGERLLKEGNAFYAAALALDDDPELWRRALDKWDSNER